MPLQPIAPPPKFQMRSSGKALLPPWLKAFGGNAERFTFLFGQACDFLLEKQQEAMLAKCPGQLTDPSFIPLQADDRLMVQGPAESNSSFIARLQDAFNAWSIAGSRHAVLGQLQGYLTDLQPGVGGFLPEMAIVGGNSDASTWDTIYNSFTQGQAPAHRVVTPANWDFDGKNQPWRSWLILYMHAVGLGQSGHTLTVAATGGSTVPGVTSGFAYVTNLTGANLTSENVGTYITISGAATSGNNGFFQIVYVQDDTSCIIANPAASAPDANSGSITWSISKYPYIGPSPVWGSPSFVWGDVTWGVSCSDQVITTLRQILSRWKSAQTYYPNIIISFLGEQGVAGDEFSPLSDQGVGNPNGTWADYGYNDNGCFVPSRIGSVANVSPFTAFCDGTGLAVRCYEKNVT